MVIPGTDSQLKRQDRMASCGAPEPFWGTTMECTLVEPQPGAPYSPSLALSISLEHTAHDPWQSSQHCITLLNNSLPTWNALRALPKLSYTGWLKPLPTFYLTAYAVALSLSLKGIYLFLQEKKEIYYFSNGKLQ